MCSWGMAVRTKRVREARDEAKKEIADYKARKDDEFKKFESEVRLTAALALPSPALPLVLPLFLHTNLPLGLVAQADRR